MDIPVVQWPRENLVDRIHIDVQEYSFAGIVKQGPLVSCLDTKTYIKVQDTANSNLTSLVFSMNVLDASKISLNQPEFETRGLSGWWKIVRQDPKDLQSQPPRIQLQEQVSVDNLDELKKLLLHSSSATFVKSRYEEILKTL